MPKNENNTKPAEHIVKLKLPVDLLDAVKSMARDSRRRSFKEMIECSLLFAVWLHNRGQGPDDVMLKLPGGYESWSKTPKSEIEELERLYEAGPS